jgi:hypothetical protein
LLSFPEDVLMHKSFVAGLMLASATPWPAQAQTANADIAQLRQDIAALRAGYEARLQALEERLQAAEAAMAAPAPPATTTTAASIAAPPPPAAPSGSGANAFNPAVSLILSGLYARTSQDPARYAITGIPLPAGAEVGPGQRGLSLAETELGISASVDPWWRGSANISLHPDDSVSVEEAFVQTTALGGGLTAKAGRFFSGVGYLNSQHAHTWDFVDNPLAYQALLGTQYGDDGVQLKWLAPTDLYLELGAELGRGRSFPGGDDARNGAGMASLSLHAGDDIGVSSSWRAGLSVLDAKASDQGLRATGSAGGAVEAAFSGRTRVWVADAVWKWAPNGNATRTSFKLQGEYLRSTREGTLTYDPAGTASGAAYRALQSGWYVQGVYQFLPGWRVGLRTERLDAGQPDFGSNASLYALAGYHPRKDSLMVDFSASEFSRIRLQLARDRAQSGAADNQLFLQYQMSLGAHGAHAY